MPFTLLVLAVGVIVGLALRGRLARLGEPALRAPWLLVGGLAAQVTVELLSRPRGPLPAGGGYLLLMLSYALILTWAMSNRARPGVVFIGTGTLSNAIVIAVNGAMPVAPAAILALGEDPAVPPPGKHELLTEATRLPWLADVMAIPPLDSIISAGDVVLGLGVVMLIVHLMTRPDEASG